MLWTLLFFIYFTQLFVKVNLFANNFEYFYGKDSIVNQKNISYSEIIVSID